jgi:short-subunit dehydrogenase
MTFVERYGPWAVVAGASEGVGAAFAAAVAREGVNVVLVARRQAVLDEVAEGIRIESAVQTRSVALDLATADATAALADATADVDVGLLVYCAGADPNYQRFLTQSAATAVAMVQRNCVVPVQLCHHYAGPMAARGRGGIILLGSGAGLAGAPNMVVYGASKAFDMVLAEALWAELHADGVDVLGLVLGETDTPALRRLRADRGLPVDPDGPLEGAATADEVVTAALEHLADGPVHLMGPLADAQRYLGGLPRKEAVQFMVQASAATMGADET